MNLVFIELFFLHLLFIQDITNMVLRKQKSTASDRKQG